MTVEMRIFSLSTCMKRSLGVGLASALIASKPSRLGPNSPSITNRFISACDASNMDLKSNPLMKNDGLPLFNEIKPEHVVPALEHDISELKANFQSLETSIQGKQKDFTLVGICKNDESDQPDCAC